MRRVLALIILIALQTPLVCRAAPRATPPAAVGAGQKKAKPSPAPRVEETPVEEGHSATLPVVAAALAAAAALGWFLIRRRAGDEVEAMASHTVVASSVDLPRVAPVSRSDWDAADAAVVGPPRCLRVVAGAEAGRVIELTERDHEMGRGEPHTVIRGRIEFHEPTISAVQAQLKWENGAFVIEHEPKATNPTLVNDRKVKRQVLQHGDNVSMGQMLLVYEVP